MILCYFEAKKWEGLIEKGHEVLVYLVKMLRRAIFAAFAEAVTSLTSKIGTIFS